MFLNYSEVDIKGKLRPEVIIQKVLSSFPCTQQKRERSHELVEQKFLVKNKNLD